MGSSTQWLSLVAPILAQRGGNGGMPHFDCPEDGAFGGDSDYIGAGLKPIPLRGNVGCVDAVPLATRPTVESNRGGASRPATNIYGPMEAGFTSDYHECLGDLVVPAGMDTQLAEAMLHAIDGCEGREILDYCGGHAMPYHYHEKLSCLYAEDATGHSTRIGTALDGHGIYGKHVDGGLDPLDLDACGGRVGVTPDSAGEPVFYCPVTDTPPFTMGCFGDESAYPVTVDQCRSLYDGCQSAPTVVTTVHGSGQFTLECPCWDSRGSNVEGQGMPCFLGNEGNCTGALSGASRSGGAVSTAMTGCVAAAVLFV